MPFVHAVLCSSAFFGHFSLSLFGLFSPLLLLLPCTRSVHRPPVISDVRCSPPVQPLTFFPCCLNKLYASAREQNDSVSPLCKNMGSKSHNDCPCCVAVSCVLFLLCISSDPENDFRCIYFAPFHDVLFLFLFSLSPVFMSHRADVLCSIDSRRPMKTSFTVS